MLDQFFHQKRNVKWLAGLLLVVVAALIIPSAAVWGQSYGDLVTEQPILLVSGQDIINEGHYSAINVSYEKSYTLKELQALPNAERLYSSINSVNTKRIYIGQGVDVSQLLALSGYTVDSGTELAFIEWNGSQALYTSRFTAAIPLNAGRLFYPNFGAATGEADDAQAVAAILAWKSAYVAAPGLPVLPANESSLRLLIGQTDINNSLFNSNVNRILAGTAITDKPLTVAGMPYTRAELLMMPRAERIYTYISSGGERNDTVRGVPLALLISELDDNAIIEFHAADDFAVDASGMSKSDLIAKNAILAYEMWNNESQAWEGIYRASGTVVGYFRLYVDGMRPAQMIDRISEKAASYTASPYKHITYSGAPYNIDAITGATLTVEGPGVKGTTPISIRVLEDTEDNNIHRGSYSDNRGAFNYEGVSVKAILDGMLKNTLPIVERLDDDVMIVFKNRWRQEIGRLSYLDVKNAKNPILLAYGTAGVDANILPPTPFVFNLAAGIVAGLGNDDGPLKLVYDQSETFSHLARLPANSKFSSVAYLYIEEGTPPPGFKHTTATNEAYSNKGNTEYLLTFTGAAIGREVSYTVAELEAMVEYEGDRPKVGGKGHRDEYGLSNTTYWYVNEYEGIKLWDLLTAIGVDPLKENDVNTLVSFSAWDNYIVPTEFSLYQLAHPEVFYFYEKSPLDIGTNRPTKAQLATVEYQPDNQGEGWIKDSNGYPVKTGYPVMLAYGLNGYPYVRNSGMAGYMSGLGNSGGPMRVIYGKTDGLNRADPQALENYAYFYNNGSNQLQRVQEVYVGEPLRYSTHLENPAEAYQAMKDLSAALTVEIISAGTKTTRLFTLAELENILYGVSKRERDNEQRQEKGYYFHKITGGNNIEDLFEGVSLEYLLTEYIGMQGVLGSVELYSGAERKAVYDLSKIGEKGKNSLRQTDGLGMMVAFAKNGYPLVSGSGATPGYISIDAVTGKDIKNNGGPLQFVRGQTAEEFASGSINNGEEAKTSVENLTRIVVNLDPDPFAHVGAENEIYARQEILFSGAVAIDGGVKITVGTLETMQKYLVTDTYTVAGQTKTYRGLDLFRLLNDKTIGASALMNEITVISSSGQSKTLSVADLTSNGKKIIIAYGSANMADHFDAAPLTTSNGGPLRLIIDFGADTDCISNISEISVSAAQLEVWKHSNGNYAKYAGYTLEISGQNLKQNKTYTVAELEDMENLFIFDYYKVSGDYFVQGLDLYKLLQNIGFAGSLATSDFTAVAADGYSTAFKGSDLLNGINGKPLIVAFGQGTSAVNGLPLVPNEDIADGYSPAAGNAYGPLRLFVHDNSGWSVKWLTKIVVGAAGGNEEPANYKFNLFAGGSNGMPQASIRAVVSDNTGGIWAASNGAGAAYISAANEITAYTTNTTPALKTDFVTALALAPDGALWLAQGGSVGSQTAPPSAHYGFASYRNGQFKFYDKNTINSTLPNDCVYGIDVDKMGNIWLTTQHTLLGGGMEGGLTKFIPATNSWQTWKMADGLPTLSAWAVKGDDKGGAWVSTYRTSNVSDITWPNQSYAHVGASGSVSPYNIPAGNDYTWSRSIAVDPTGGAYITRMSGAHDPANDGGWLDYIAPNESIQCYKGDDLITDLKSKARPGFYPEIRTVFVDKAGELWLGTNGLGVYRCAVSAGKISILENYSSATECWPTGPFDDVWSIHVSAEGKVVFGSNGGVAWTKIEMPVSYNYYLELIPEKTAATADETICIDIMLTGDLNYFQLMSQIAYDSNMLKFIGYENLAGLVGEVIETTSGNISVRSIPTLNTIIGAPCTTPVRIVTLKFVINEDYKGSDANAVFALPTIVIAAPGGVIGATTAPGQKVTVKLSSS